MSREIRFRCWDSATGEVSEPFDVKEDWGDYLIDFKDYSADGALDSIIWERYTGLKDKNGKEIYEGDIVKEDIEVGDDDIDGEYRYQVVWDEETLCWSLSPNYGTIHKDLWETNLSREVIGNVHENPELLGGGE